MTPRAAGSGDGCFATLAAVSKKKHALRGTPSVRDAPRQPRAPKPVTVRPIDWSAWRERIAIVLVLAVATALAYGPALDARFLNWDDPAYASANPNIREFSWRTVTWAFTTFQEGIWHPLTWLSLALDYRLYGLDPYGFHLTNVLLHIANTGMVFLVWDRLTGARWPSAAAAALFGLHPMHVESVAWVTERKDVLSTFFWLLTIAAYARWVRIKTPLAGVAVAGTFLLGLLSKPMLVTLPFVLLLLDYWPLGRLSWQAAIEKLPLLLLAVAVAAVGMVAVAGVGAAAIPDPIPAAALVANALVSSIKYLALTLWPANLSPWYSHPWFEGQPLTIVAVAGSGLLLVAITGLVMMVAKRRPYAPVGWFWFLGTLVPVLGLLYNGRQGMADRYVYIPHIGLFVALTWAVAELPLWRAPMTRTLSATVFMIGLAVLGLRTARQARIWHDDGTFWGHTVKVNHDSFIAHQALAILMQSAGRTPESIALYARATRIRPELAKVHVQFAKLLLRSGRPGPAAAAYRKALTIEPNAADSRYGLAQILLTQGRPSRARRELVRALASRPAFPEARQSLDRINGALAAHAPD